MKILLIILLAIHGIIHLFGFLKAFGLSEFKAISQPVPKMTGVFWLATFMLFVITVLLFISQQNYWWSCCFLAIILSQILIIKYWSDAKFGTILNLLILIPAVIAFSTDQFQKTVDQEILQLLAASTTSHQSIITQQMMVDLPTPVQTWLSKCGTIGKENINHVFLEQSAEILLNPEQKAWTSAKAKQYFTVDPPAFNWSVNLKMNPGIDVVGRDKFENGKGEMTIKVLAILPVENAKDNQQINQATLQRYLAEIVWFPTAALSPYINWSPIDDYAAKATMAYNGTLGSGIFHFDENGNFKKFVAMRYKEVNDSNPTRWTVTATKTEQRNGIKIPVESKVAWELENGDWTWLKIKITNIEYR